MPSCYAPGCKHKSRNASCSFFRFPADTKQFHEWRSLCPRKGKLPTKEDRLCSCHFIDGIKLNLPTVFADSKDKFELLHGLNTDEAVKSLKTKDPQNNNMSKKHVYECRACLEIMDSRANLVDLFQAWTQPWEGMKNTIAEDLATIGNIQVSTSDRHSKVICNSCFKKLQAACNFTAVVKRSDTILSQRYPVEQTDQGDMVWPKPIQLDKNVNGTVFETAMDIEIKQEVLSDNDCGESINGNSDAHYKCITDCVEIKIEPEEMTRPPTIQINGTFSCKGTDAAVQSALSNGNEMLEEYLETPLKEEPTSGADSDAMSTTDLSLECMLCAKAFHSVSGLKAHVIAQHSYKSVKRKAGGKQSPSKKKDKYVCATCRRSFVTPTDLMVHETCHNKATCYSCSQKFDTFEQLTKHRVRCKVVTATDLPKPKTLEDVKRTIAEERKCLEDEDLPGEQLQCHLCPERFSDSYYMTIHQEIHHNPGEQAPPPQPEAPMETETLESIFSEDK